MISHNSFSCLLASSTMRMMLISTAFMASFPALAASEDTPIVVSAPAPLPAISYSDENAKPQTFSASGHKLTALHFWATWCVPCVAELPVVDKVQQDNAAKGLNIIALSEDGANNMKKVQDFYAKNGIKALKANIDTDMKALQTVKLRGMPTTIFVDEKGNEIARAEGAMNWNSPDMAKFLADHLK